MDEVSRRDALQRAAGVSLAAAAPVQAGEPAQAPAPKTDRECVLAVGMTEAEADCWALAAKLAGTFFQLPAQHPSDEEEVSTAIHVIQNKLLARPTYRRYLELAKAAHRARNGPEG